MTPKYKIVQALRKLWLTSKERGEALKRDKYTCQVCGRKASKAKGKECKVHVHHESKHIDWDKIVKYIRKELLVDSKHLTTLCVDCHKGEHEDGR